MAPYESDTGVPGENAARRPVRRKATRYAVPAAVAGVAAVTVGLVPALADSGNPELPKISAQQLIEKIAASDTDQLSGTFRISTDLGLPDLGGMGSLPGAAGSGGSGSSADPQAKLTELASGTHTLRVAADGPQKQKLSLLEDAAEYSLVRNGQKAWAYDSGSNQAVRFTTPVTAGKQRGKGAEGLPKGMPTTPKELAEQTLKAVDDTTSVTVDGTARIAGRDAYQLLVRPKQSGSTVESVRIGVDAKTGMPLRFTLNSVDGGKPVVNAGFTKVDFAKPAASTFDFSPPKGTKVTEGDTAGSGKAGREGAEKLPEGAAGLDGVKVLGKGWGSIATLDMPGGKGLPTTGSGEVPPEAEKLLNSLGDQVKGSFGTGTVFSTRLVNALVTQDGHVYAGAVDKAALVKAADAAK